MKPSSCYEASADDPPPSHSTVKANVGASKEDALTEKELIAQLSCVTIYCRYTSLEFMTLPAPRTLIFAATDTTSNALTLVLECLAKNPEVQHRLRAELREAKSRHEGGDLPYDELMALPYLDAVCAETLRVYVVPLASVSSCLMS